IDQPAKMVASIRHGVWGAGGHSFASADVALSIGNNPIVSQLSLPGGIPGNNPVKRLGDEKKRGLVLIVVDPRRSEVAKHADLHLQIRPGEDPTLLAGMLRTIFEEDLYDADFCGAHVRGIEALREAVSGFTPDHVEERTGIPVAQMLEAARRFARGPRGSASSGTGPDMSPRANLTEHLIMALNTLCGRHNREGDPIANPGVLSPERPHPAQAVPPEFLPRMLTLGGDPAPRVRGLQQIFGEMPTAAIAEEILLPGEGQIRALFSTGGNAVAAWPDPTQTRRALESLDLHVVIEAQWTESARLANYVLPTRLPLEREDVTYFADPFYEQAYSFYSDAVVEPEFEALEDWQVFVELARRMGTPISIGEGEIDPEDPPSKKELLERLTQGARIPLSTIRGSEGGRLYPEAATKAAAAFEGIEARLDVAPEGVPEELAELRAERIPIPGRYGEDGTFTHLLIARRMRHVMNSVGQGWPESSKRGTTNPAFLCRADCEALGFAAGDLVEIESEHETILGVIEPVDDLQPGVVSMSHAWGSGGGRETDVRKLGAHTGRLVATNKFFDPTTGMVRMSAIPVRLVRAD
ncbi:MAG: molybdopterin-dependent oxidoreductase, partial [bacterium]|nr:molybdopterin-dependent oxidoreductase [bacterium]